MDRLTNRHEAPVEKPWSVAEAPEDFIAGQLRAIVGVELIIERIEAKIKLSQNRSKEDVLGVVEGLSGIDDALARAIRQANEL